MHDSIDEFVVYDASNVGNEQFFVRKCGGCKIKNTDIDIVVVQVYGNMQGTKVVRFIHFLAPLLSRTM